MRERTFLLETTSNNVMQWKLRRGAIRRLRRGFCLGLFFFPEDYSILLIHDAASMCKSGWQSREKRRRNIEGH